MWIWIGIGVVVWLLWGVWICQWIRRGLGSHDIAMYTASVISPPICMMAAYSTWGRNCFKKGNKMEKIYWDESQQQIRTKGGECLLDKAVLLARLNSLEERIKGHQVTRNILSIRLAKLENAQYTKTLYDKNLGKIKTLTDSINSYAKAELEIKKQLQCSAKGHKMVYSKLDLCLNCFTLGIGQRDYSKRFVFKCSICDLEITKTEKELSAVEKEALKKLKLL